MPRDEKKARFDQIDKLYKQEKPAALIVLARSYVADYPDHGFVWLLYGEALSELARYSEALPALRRALRLCPPDKRHIAYRRFGFLHRQRGAHLIAARWFRKAVEANPHDATDRIFLGAVLARAGLLEEAEAVHRDATRCEKGPIDEAFLNLGFILRAQERFKEARDCFKRALAIDPNYKDAKRALADVETALASGKPRLGQ